MHREKNMRILKYIAILGLVTAAGALADTPDAMITPPGMNLAPIGLAATTTKLLFSQPFCQTDAITTRAIYSVSSIAPHAATLFSTLPNLTFGGLQNQVT